MKQSYNISVNIDGFYRASYASTVLP